MVKAKRNNSMMGIQTYQPKTTNISLIGTPNNCVQNTNTTEGTIFATHGRVTYSANGGSSYIGMTTKNNGTIEGSGIAFKFPFKQGTNYTINIGVMNTASEAPPEQTASLSRRPELQIQLTNNAPLSPSCNTLAAPVTLVAPGPTSTVPLSQSNTQGSIRSINFSPTECYNFLRFSALPNMTGISEGVVTISSISIVANNGIEVTGPSYLDVNDQGTFNVTYAGLPINEQFNWRVSGNLQIVGSTTGSSAVVKSTGLGGGTIYADLNGCQEIATKIFPQIDNQYISITGPGQVRVNATVPSRFDIVLSGPLVGKTITNTVWTIPAIYGNEYWGDTFIELWPTGSTGGKNLVANFLIDGTPAAVKRFVKVAP